MHDAIKRIYHLLISVAFLGIIGILLSVAQRPSDAYVTPNDQLSEGFDFEIGSTMPTNDYVYYGATYAWNIGDVGIYRGDIPTCLSGFDTTTGATNIMGTVRNLIDSDCGIRTFTEDASYIYVGGIFLYESNNNYVYMVARFSKATNELDTSFSPITSDMHASGSYPYVTSSHIDGNYLYIGGRFTFDDNGTTYPGIARINLSTGQLDPTWTPQVQYSLWDSVTTIDSDNTYIYIGGDFSTVEGVTRHSLARLAKADGSLDSWNPDPGASRTIREVIVDSGSVYVSGNPYQYASNPTILRPSITRFDTTTGAMDETWTTNAQAHVTTNSSVLAFDLLIHNSYLYMAGWADSAPLISRLTLSTGLRDNTWNSPLTFAQSAGFIGGGYPYSIAIDGQGVFIFGDFHTINGSEHMGMAKLSLVDRSLIDAWTTETKMYTSNQNARHIIYNGTVYHGSINLINPQPTSVIGRYVKDTMKVDTTWNVTVVPKDASTYAMEKDDTYIYMGGDWTSINGQAIAQLARFNQTTGVLDTTNIFDIPSTIFSKPTPSSHEIYALHIHNGYLYVGGICELDGYVIRIDLTTDQIDTAWGPILLDDSVQSIDIDGDYIYVGGWFSTPLSGVLRAQLSDATVDSLWDLQVDSGVDSVIVDQGNIFLGSWYSFTHVLGEARVGFAKVAIDTKTLDPLTLTFDSEYPVYKMNKYGDSICMGGEFKKINGVLSPGFACINSSNGDIEFTIKGVAWSYRPQFYGSTAFIPGADSVNKIDILFNIQNLDSTLDAEVAGNNIEEGSAFGEFGQKEVLLLKNNNLIATSTTIMGSDKDWTNVSADIDTTTKKAFVHNLSSAEGVQNYSLHVPKDVNDNRVFVCPDVNSISSIQETCFNGVEFSNNSTKNVTFLNGTQPVTATQTTYNGNEYWELSGVIGTGGMSYETIDPTSTPTVSITSTVTPTVTTSITSTVSPTITSTLIATGTIPPVVSTPISPSDLPPTTSQPNESKCEAQFVSLNSSDSIIIKGNKITISWETENANRILFVNEGRDLIKEGFLSRKIDKTTTFEFIAYGDDCQTRESITVSAVDVLPWTNSALVGVAAISIETAVATFGSFGGNILLSLAGIFDKRKASKWGIVYDSKTQKPISRAILRIYKEGSKDVVSTVVTDAYGAFKLIAKKGEYVINVIHPEYLFPSKIFKDNNDDKYKETYLGEKLKLNDESNQIMVSIPMDQKNLSDAEERRIKAKALIRMIVNNISTVIFAGGLGYTIYSQYNFPHIFNLIALIIYLALTGYKASSIILNNPKTSGTVKNIKGELIAGIEIGIFDTEFNNLLYRTFSSDSGEYNFSVPADKDYAIKILDNNYVIAYQGLELEELKIKKGKKPGIKFINKDITIKEI